MACGPRGHGARPRSTPCCGSMTRSPIRCRRWKSTRRPRSKASRSTASIRAPAPKAATARRSSPSCSRTPTFCWCRRCPTGRPPISSRVMPAISDGTSDAHRIYTTLPALDSFSALELWLSLNSQQARGGIGAAAHRRPAPGPHPVPDLQDSLSARRSHDEAPESAGGAESSVVQGQHRADGGSQGQQVHLSRLRRDRFPRPHRASSRCSSSPTKSRRPWPRAPASTRSRPWPARTTCCSWSSTASASSPPGVTAIHEVTRVMNPDRQSGGGPSGKSGVLPPQK